MNRDQRRPELMGYEGDEAPFEQRALDLALLGLRLTNAQAIADARATNAPRKAGEVFREAARRGMPGVAPRADEACKSLLLMGFLTREDEGFKAVKGMKVRIVEA